MLTSTFKNNAIKYSLQNIKQNNRIVSVISWLIFVGLLIFTSSSIYFMNLPEKTDTYSLAMSINTIAGIMMVGIMSAGAGIMIGVFGIPVAMFNYLHQKSRNDMIFSLPIKKKSRFISDYLTGLLVTLVPTFILGIISVSLITVSANIAGNNTESLFYQNFMTWCTLSQFITAIWKVFLLGILFEIFVYTIVTLAAQFTGTIIDCVIFLMLRACLISFGSRLFGVFSP